MKKSLLIFIITYFLIGRTKQIFRLDKKKHLFPSLTARMFTMRTAHATDNINLLVYYKFSISY